MINQTRSKKEIKGEYKLLKFKMGVFQVRNTVTEKIFVDSSPDLDAIWNRTRFQLDFGNHPNAALQKDWNDLGADKFKYEIVSELEQKDTEMIDINKELKALLQLWLEELQPYGDKGYNVKK